MAKQVPQHLFLDEDEVALLILGPKRAKEWPAMLKQIERRGFPPIDPFWRGRSRIDIEDFIKKDRGGAGSESGGGDEFVTVVPFAPDGPEFDRR